MDVKRNGHSAPLPNGIDNRKSKLFTVELRKSSRGLGIGILKAEGDPEWGRSSSFVKIHELYPHQPARQCGRLRVGDIILKVNAVRLFGKSPLQALEILRATSGLVTLTIYRPDSDDLANNNELSSDKIETSDQTLLNQERRASIVSDSSNRMTAISHEQGVSSQPPSPNVTSYVQDVPPEADAKPTHLLTATSDTSDLDHSDVDVVPDESAFSSIGAATVEDEDSVEEQKCVTNDNVVVCRRCDSMDGLGGRSNGKDAFDRSLNSPSPLERHASDMVRSCCNDVVLRNRSPRDPGLTKWRGSMLSDDEDDDPVERLRDQVRKERAKSTSALSLEVECVTVQLHRGWHTKLGFSLEDCDPFAQDTPRSPVIKTVYPGSLASKDGRILPGDFLIQVNDLDLLGTSSKDAIEYIKRCGGIIRMLLIRVHKSYDVPTTI